MGRRGAGPYGGGVGRSPAIYFDDFLWIFGKKILVLKDRILANTEF